MHGWFAANLLPMTTLFASRAMSPALGLHTDADWHYSAQSMLRLTNYASSRRCVATGARVERGGLPTKFAQAGNFRG